MGIFPSLDLAVFQVGTFFSNRNEGSDMKGDIEDGDQSGIWQKLTSWWFQPLWKLWVKMIIFLKFRWTSTYLKPTPSLCWWFWEPIQLSKKHSSPNFLGSFLQSLGGQHIHLAANNVKPQSMRCVGYASSAVERSCCFRKVPGTSLLTYRATIYTAWNETMHFCPPRRCPCHTASCRTCASLSSARVLFWKLYPRGHSIIVSWHHQSSLHSKWHRRTWWFGPDGLKVALSSITAFVMSRGHVHFNSQQPLNTEHVRKCHDPFSRSRYVHRSPATCVFPADCDWDTKFLLPVAWLNFLATCVAAKVHTSDRMSSAPAALLLVSGYLG